MPRRKPTAQPEQRFYSISVAARILNTHPQTLRMYERLGLIKPRRNEHGNRLYSDADIERVRKIQELTQEMGVNLSGVEVAFKLMARIEELEAELNQLRKRFWQAVQEQAEQLFLASGAGTSGAVGSAIGGEAMGRVHPPANLSCAGVAADAHREAGAFVKRAAKA